MKRLVIAGNDYQYKDWLRHTGRRLDDCQYISKLNDLRGLWPGTVIYLVGTYWDNEASWGGLLWRLEREDRIKVVRQDIAGGDIVEGNIVKRCRERIKSGDITPEYALLLARAADKARNTAEEVIKKNILANKEIERLRAIVHGMTNQISGRPETDNPQEIKQDDRDERDIQRGYKRGYHFRGTDNRE